MFEPNTKVVCVDDNFPAGIHDFYNALPIRDRIYTVRDVVPGIQFDCRATCTILLEELVNLPNRHGIEPGFRPERFRELQDSDVTVEEVAAEIA